VDYIKQEIFADIEEYGCRNKKTKREEFFEIISWNKSV
jgi:hypothetical protein